MTRIAYDQRLPFVRGPFTKQESQLRRYFWNASGNSFRNFACQHARLNDMHIVWKTVTVSQCYSLWCSSASGQLSYLAFWKIPYFTQLFRLLSLIIGSSAVLCKKCLPVFYEQQGEENWAAQCVAFRVNAVLSVTCILKMKCIRWSVIQWVYSETFHSFCSNQFIL